MATGMLLEMSSISGEANISSFLAACQLAVIIL
jgi:hypothetical protein